MKKTKTKKSPRTAKKVKPAATGGYMNVKAIEAHFGVKLPDRLKKLITTREYKKYQGKCLGLPSSVDADDKTFTVDFDSPLLFQLFKKHRIEPDTMVDCHPGNDPRGRDFIPLCLLNKGRGPFIAIRLDNIEPAVLFFEQEERMLYDCASTLDDFLIFLYDKKDIPPSKVAEKTFEQAVRLYQHGEPAKSLALLTAPIRIALEQDDDFNEIMALDLIALGRAAEAVKVLGDEADVDVFFKVRDFEKVASCIAEMKEGDRQRGGDSSKNGLVVHAEGRMAILAGDRATAVKGYQWLFELLTRDLATESVKVITEGDDRWDNMRAIESWSGTRDYIARLKQEIVEVATTPEQRALATEIIDQVKLPKPTDPLTLLFWRAMNHLYDDRFEIVNRYMAGYLSHVNAEWKDLFEELKRAIQQRPEAERARLNETCRERMQWFIDKGSLKKELKEMLKLFKS
jgi:hypothetical protein